MLSFIQSMDKILNIGHENLCMKICLKVYCVHEHDNLPK